MHPGRPHRRCTQRIFFPGRPERLGRCADVVKYSFKDCIQALVHPVLTLSQQFTYSEDLFRPKQVPRARDWGPFGLPCERHGLYSLLPCRQHFGALSILCVIRPIYLSILYRTNIVRVVLSVNVKMDFLRKFLKTAYERPENSIWYSISPRVRVEPV